jgi:hypothetical protein
VGANIVISSNIQNIFEKIFSFYFLYFWRTKNKWINGKYKVIRKENKDRFINELIELLKMPSVSADAAYSQDVIETSEVVKSWKSRMWFRRNLWNWRLPIVKRYWQRLANSIGLRSFDVQPADPMELWTSPHLSLW